jgi:hypothetical protein
MTIFSAHDLVVSAVYYSTNKKHDGKFRKVEVKVGKPDLVARTKKGYYAKKDKKS